VILKPFRYGSVCSGIEAATVAWHPLGWRPAFFSEIEKFPRAVLQHHYPDVPLHGDFTSIKGDEYGPLTFSWGEPHANPSVSPDSEKDCPTNGETSRWSILDWLRALAPGGSFGKTSPASCPLEKDGILVPSSGRWLNSGMGSPTECLTLNISEWPSDAVVCSLSDILETGDLPQRFFLSAKACTGILRRVERRGRQLPYALRCALKATALAATGPQGRM
jgi:hypothetical protein